MWNSAQGLRDYNNWIGRSPEDIRRAVRGFKNGWEDVFPTSKRFPTWASRVRTYFNITPKQLTQIGGKERGRIKSRHRMTPGALFDKGVFMGTFSLSGDVYLDEDKRPWFEMSTVSTIHHFKGKVNGRKKASYFFRRQKTTPVFKLISPDGTGGSLELCIHNWQYRGSTPSGEIGKVGETVNLHGKVVINSIYQGSYNYADNGFAGPDEHEHMDVFPHLAHEKFYLRAGSKRRYRRFPKYDDWGNKVLDSHLIFPISMSDHVEAHKARLRKKAG